MGRHCTYTDRPHIQLLGCSNPLSQQVPHHEYIEKKHDKTPKQTLSLQGTWVPVLWIEGHLHQYNPVPWQYMFPKVSPMLQLILSSDSGAETPQETPWGRVWLHCDALGCNVRVLRKDLGAHQRNDGLHLRHALDTVMKMEDSKNFFTFKLTQYRSYMGRHFDSPHFSHCGGDSMYITVWVNGPNYISVSLISKNPPLPLKGTITVSLLNQLADENHHTRKCDFEATENDVFDNDKVLCMKIPEFIPYSRLTFNLGRYTQYLKDDTLFFQVLVQTSDSKPWLKCD